MACSTQIFYVRNMSGLWLEFPRAISQAACHVAVHQRNCMAIGAQGKSSGDEAAAATGSQDVAGQQYHVHLPGFDGPLALLLHLIERNQLEITTISLVSVTDQFIHYVRTWGGLAPLEQLAEFVAMAARLLLIKSRSLLPAPPHSWRRTTMTPIRSRMPNSCASVSWNTKWRVKSRRRCASGSWPGCNRSRALAACLLNAGSQLADFQPPQIVGVSPAALAAVFRRVLTEKHLSQPEELPLPAVTIAEKMEEVERLLSKRRGVPRSKPYCSGPLHASW